MPDKKYDDNSFGAVSNTNTQNCCRKIITIKEVRESIPVAASAAAAPAVCTNYGSLTSTQTAPIPSTNGVSFKTSYFNMIFPDTLDRTHTFTFNHIQFLLHDLIVTNIMGVPTLQQQNPNMAKLSVYIYKLIDSAPMITSELVATGEAEIKQIGFTEVKLNETVEVTNEVESDTNSSRYYMAVTLTNTNDNLVFAGNSIIPGFAIDPLLFGFSAYALTPTTTLQQLITNNIGVAVPFTVPFYVLYNI